MLELFKANWKPVALIVSLLVAGYLGYELRSVIAERDAQTVQSKVLQQDKTNLTDAVTQAHNVQAKHELAAQQIAAADTNYIQGVSDGKKELDNAVTVLRNTLRVRTEQLAAERRKRQQSESGHVPDTAACTRECDGEAGSDFLVAHGEDALRLAAEADDVTRQLQSCQQTIITYQNLSSSTSFKHK
jgi:prophage endopeptidase